MKKAIKPSAILLVIFLLSSCLKEDHSVRLKNDYSARLTDAVVSNTQLGDVASGTSTGYKSINTGDFKFSANTSNGLTISGGGNISGAGKHKWTITVNGDASCTMKEDK